jgi:hypothetical protein
MMCFRNQQCLGPFSAIIFLLVLLLPGDSFAFRPSGTKSANKMRSPTQTPPIGGDIRFDASDALNIRVLPQPESKPPVMDVDFVKARDLARHFGKYTYEEIENMRDDLKEHRFRDVSPSEVFLGRLFEDELTSQLQALKDGMPDPYLFRDDPSTKGLFSSEGHTASTHPASVAEKTKTTKGGLDIIERLFDEGVLEYLVICIVAGIIMLARRE